MNQKFYDVPAGTRASQCRGATCGASIYWINTERSRIPVDCAVDGGYAPTPHASGSGVSHFTTSPDVRQFSGKNRA